MSPLARRLGATLLLAICLGGCVQTQSVTLATPAGRADLNARAEGRTARLRLRNAPPRSVRALHIGPVETTWVDRLNGEPRSAPTADVSGVSVRRTGAWRPVLIGAGIGVVAGAVLGATQQCRSFICFGPEFFAAGGGVFGTLVGTGVAATRVDTYRIEPDTRLGTRPDSLAGQ